MRKVSVVTVARSDFGVYRQVLKRIVDAHDLDLHLMVSGMHLSREFGYTVEEIEREGFPVSDRIEMLLASDTPEGIAKSVGMGVIGFAQSFASFRPDLLLILGDRFEMMAAAVAAMPFGIPIAHIGGGEITEGAIDEAIRHSLTKMSHLHFVQTEEYRQRVIQLGEEEWRVVNCGAPSLDNIRHLDLLDPASVCARIGMPGGTVPLLVTYHPVTLEYEHTVSAVAEVMQALNELQMPIVFTYPNADTGNNAIVGAIEEFVTVRDWAYAVKNLGTRLYFSLMRFARAMVGNSSSGIIEAASFELPVVNIGSRQKGRVRGRNVIDVPAESARIVAATRKACSEEFRRSLAGMENPYGAGHASDVITRVLQGVSLDDRLIVKQFVNAA